MGGCEESRGNTHVSATEATLAALAEQNAIAIYRLRREVARLQAELLTVTRPQAPIEAPKP